MRAASKPIGTGGPVTWRDVDEDDLVKRYTLGGLSLAACARRFGVSGHRVQAILAARGVPVRQRRRPPADQAKVVAAYRRHRSLQLIGAAFGLSHDKARAILAAHGVELAPQPKPVVRTGPGSGRWVTQAQAARLLGAPKSVIRRAAAGGQVRVQPDESGRRWYWRADVEALRDRLGPATSASWQPGIAPPAAEAMPGAAAGEKGQHRR